MTFLSFLRTYPFLAFFVAVLVVPVTYWLNDRDPPYARSDGVIVPVEPELCHLPPGSHPVALVPLACVRVDWKMDPKRNCEPSRQFNVTRSITNMASGSRTTLPQIQSIYRKDRNIDSDIVRYFQLPASLATGKNNYDVSVCFVCNPLEKLAPSLLEICVDKPGIEFYSGEQPTQGPR